MYTIVEFPRVFFQFLVYVVFSLALFMLFSLPGITYSPTSTPLTLNHYPFHFVSILNLSCFSTYPSVRKPVLSPLKLSGLQCHHWALSYPALSAHSIFSLVSFVNIYPNMTWLICLQIDCKLYDGKDYNCLCRLLHPSTWPQRALILSELLNDWKIGRMKRDKRAKNKGINFNIWVYFLYLFLLLEGWMKMLWTIFSWLK